MTVAKKAAPVKAAKKPAKKTTPRAVKTAGAVAVAAPPVPARKFIVVEGREIAVKKPTIEQLTDLWDVLDAITSIQDAANQFEKVSTYLKLYYRLTAGLFVNDEDKEWFKEARFDGVVSIEKDSVIGMIPAIAEAYKDELGVAGNRADRRAAARKKA